MHKFMNYEGLCFPKQEHKTESSFSELWINFGYTSVYLTLDLWHVCIWHMTCYSSWNSRHISLYTYYICIVLQKQRERDILTKVRGKEEVVAQWRKVVAQWRKVLPSGEKFCAQSCSYKGAARWVLPESKQLMDLNFAMQCCTVHCSVHRGNIAIKTCHLRKLSVVISEWNQPRLNTTVKMGAFEEVKDSLNHLSLKIYEHPKGFHNTSMPKLSWTCSWSLWGQRWRRS